MDNNEAQPKDAPVFRGCFLIFIGIILIGLILIFAWVLSSVLNIELLCVLPIIGPPVLYVGINEAYKWIRRSGPSFELASGE